MPLLDHFHPPLHGPRRWEGFHHAWATVIAQQLNEILPPGYYAESEISLGPELEVDVAAIEFSSASGGSAVTTPASSGVAVAVWSPPKPVLSVAVDFARLDSYEVRVYQDIGGGAELRAAIELVSPANKDRPGSRRVFAAKCAGYLKRGIALVIVDVVSSRAGNLHQDLFEALEAAGNTSDWSSPTGLYAVAYRPVTVRNMPRVEAWPESLGIGNPLPELPLWLAIDLCLPLRLEQSYMACCRTMRIPA